MKLDAAIVGSAFRRTMLVTGPAEAGFHDSDARLKPEPTSVGSVWGPPSGGPCLLYWAFPRLPIQQPMTDTAAAWHRASASRTGEILTVEFDATVAVCLRGETIDD